MLKILTAATVALVLIPSISQAATLRILNRGALVALNPQPLPPGPPPCRACGVISPKLMINTKVLMFRR